MEESGIDARNIHRLEDGGYYYGDQWKDQKPTRDNILNALEELRDRLTPEDVLYLAWNGHGVEIGGYPFSFCPTDADLDRIQTRITLDDIWARLRVDGQLITKRIFLVMNACRNDPRDGQTAKLYFQQRVSRPPRGVVVLFSCSKDQQSWIDEFTDRSFFFEALLQGWKGGASDAEGMITMESLVAYVKKRTEKLAEDRRKKRQTPGLLTVEELTAWVLPQPAGERRYIATRLPGSFFVCDKDWENHTFENIDFNGRILATYNFNGCRFIRCQFVKTEFVAKTRLLNAVFEDCELVSTDFTKASTSARTIRVEGPKTVVRDVRWFAGVEPDHYYVKYPELNP